MEKDWGYVFWSCWLMASTDLPSDITGYWHCSWLPSRNDGETLLLQTSHTCVTERGEYKLVLTLHLHSYLLAFMVLEGAMYATKGEK